MQLVTLGRRSYNIVLLAKPDDMLITILLVAKSPLTRAAIATALKARQYAVVPVGTADAAYSSFDAIVFDGLVVHVGPD